MMPKLREILPAFYLALCLIFGGSGAGGVIANAALQILGLALIIMVFAAGRSFKIVRTERHLVLLGSGILIIGLCQLVPLPPAVWPHLGGRADIVRGFALIGAPLPWLPIALWPSSTLSSLAALIPPLAIVILIVFAGSGCLRLVGWTVVGLAAVSFLLGFAQLASGPESSLYFYKNTNRDQLVGFFANSNHLATLGVVALPLLSALAGGEIARDRGLSGKAGSWAALGCLAGFITLGVVADGSIAGMILLVPAVLGSFVLLRTEQRSLALPVVASLLVVSAAIFIAIAVNSPLINNFGGTDFSTGAQSRAGIFARSYAAIRAYFPFGSGLGSFLLVYPGFAADSSASSFYVNHAHNDYLEFIMETGLAGCVLLILFMIWWLRQTFFAWRDAGIRARFARATSIASGLIMAHSLADYPIRTTAIAVVFAACCSIMARPLSTFTPQMFASGSRRSPGKMVHADG